MSFPDISRRKAKTFAENIEAAIEKPSNSPLLHYAHGIGGIGKSTLINQLIKNYASGFQCAKTFFGINSPINTPIELMKTLNGQLVDSIDGWGGDIFKELYETWQQALKDVENEVHNEESSEEQKQKLAIVKQIGSLAKSVIAVSGIVTSGGAGAVAANAGGSSLIDALAEGASSSLQITDLLKQLKTTRDKPELQELIANPIPKLAKAFIDTVIQKSQSKPVILFIDTYEKASSEFDAFFCKYLLSDKALQNAPVRIVMAGRYSLKNKRYKRMFQQYRNNLISETQLDKFSEKVTTIYLKEIGITEKKEIKKFWRATKGYPYYLNLIREQKENGKTVKLSRGGRDIVDLLLDGLNETERKVVTIAAYCRWFDEPIIEHLLAENNIGEEPSSANSWFEWLINRDFVIEDNRYSLDDVARDIIRTTEHNNNDRNFNQKHQQLADYFQQRGDREVEAEELIQEKYEYPEWREYITESIYHELFAHKKKGQIKLLTHFFEGAYLKEPSLTINAYTAIEAESDLDNDEYKLLPGNTKTFLMSISLAIVFGWMFVGANPDIYKIGFDSEEKESDLKAEKAFESLIEASLEKCFKQVRELQGLAKCFGLYGSCLRCKDIEQKLSLLHEAKGEIERLGINKYQELGSYIFFSLGKTLGDLERYEEALGSYDKAIAINPQNDSALNARALRLSLKGEFEKSISDIDRAIELAPDEILYIANKGIILARQENYREALNYCDRAISINPQHESGYLSCERRPSKHATG